MKFRAVIFAILIFVFLIQSCIPSLHPLYTKDKIVYLEQMEGVWSDQPGDVKIEKRQKVMGEEKNVVVTINAEETDRPEIWDFRKDDDGYVLIHQDSKGRKAAFEVFVVKLGDDYFMDFYLSDFPKGESPIPSDVLDHKENDLAVNHLLPVHTFAKLIVDDNEVKIRMFDPEFLEKLFKQRQIRIKHEVINDDTYVLTAQPEELQKFVEKYADENEAYIDDLIVLHKQT